MKKIVLILLLLLPVNIYAFTGSVSINCSNNNITVGESTTCSISGYTDSKVSSIALKIGGNCQLSGYSVASGWQGMVE